MGEERGSGLEDLEDLVDFRIAGEERFARPHLGEDGAAGPHVDTCTVLSAAEEDLGCAVPQCDDLTKKGQREVLSGSRECDSGGRAVGSQQEDGRADGCKLTSCV